MHRERERDRNQPNPIKQIKSNQIKLAVVGVGMVWHGMEWSWIAWTHQKGPHKAANDYYLDDATLSRDDLWTFLDDWQKMVGI
mmetsp:Transcript_3152/g.8722  ORF Transcript_3152/g.8722 Transcript_3152/m.8722 type:complete len:83 (+) Transcript_3152:451-699(+)